MNISNSDSRISLPKKCPDCSLPKGHEGECGQITRKNQQHPRTLNMKTPTNTTKEVNSNPIIGLFTAMAGGIEAQERRGQSELVNSEVLPTDIQREDRKKMEALGFVFGDPVGDDPMFQKATLPNGWKRQGSDHAMWSYIVDERGLKRVAIFYKAAFYDRSANMSLVDVGYNLASDFIWGDEKTPTIPANLTPEERASAKAACETSSARDRRDRISAFLAALG